MNKVSDGMDFDNQIALLGYEHRPSDPSTLLEIAGNHHWYQKRTLYLMTVERMILGFLMHSIPFLFYSPAFICFDENNVLKECTEVKACANQYGFMTRGDRTSLVTIFNLYCDRKTYGDLAKTFIFLFAGFSTMLTSALSDLYGRKFMFKILFISLFAGSALSLSSSFTAIVIGLALSFAALDNFFTFKQLYCNEIIGSGLRTRFGAIINFTSSLFGIIVNLIFVYSDGYKVAFYVPLVTIWYMLIMYFCLVETPFYLLRIKDTAGLKHSLKKICHINFSEPERSYRTALIDKKLDPKLTSIIDTEGLADVRMNKQASETEVEIETSTIKYAYEKGIFRMILKFTILFVHTAFMFSIFSFGLQHINSYSLKVNGIAIQASTNFSFLTLYFLAPRVRRRSFIIVQASISVLIGIALYIIQAYKLNTNPKILLFELIIELTLVWSALTLDGLIWLFAIETFPTRVRAVAISVSASVGKLAFSFGPLLVTVMSSYEMNPLILSGLTGLATLLVSLTMEETFNKNISS